MSLDISLLVTSCDKYSFLWSNLCKQIDKYWKVDSDKYILSETVQAKERGFYTIFAGKDHWSDMMIKALSVIKSEYIFVMMDDDYPNKAITEGFISEHLNFLKDNDYNKIMFSGASTDYDLTHIGGKLFKYNDNSNYQTSLQPSIWRKSFLQECLVHGMNPWQFEVEGTNRIKGRDNKVFLLNMDHLTYNVVRKGRVDPHWHYFKQMEGLEDFK